MVQNARNNKIAFLEGGGEMGALIRAFDWSHHPLGDPVAWPQSFRTTLRLLLNTGHPMYIWWGPELYCFYNDAYRQSIGPERHPGSLGRPGREVWEEIWPIIGPQIDQVMSGGGATWHVNALVPITRNGQREDVYWTYSYGPIDDEEAPNGVGGVLVVCTETTEAVLAQQAKEQETARQRRLFEQAPGFIIIMTGPEHLVDFVNDVHRQVFNSADWIGKTIRDAFPSIAGQGFYEALDEVYATGKTIEFRRQEVRYRRAGPSAAEETRYLNFIYAPTFDERGAVVGIFCEGFDVTEAMRADRRLEIVRETGAAVAAEHDLNTIVQIVTDAGVELTGAQFGAFFYNVVNEKGESYTLYALSGAPRSAFENFPMPRNTAVFGPTFNGEGIVRSDDIKKDPRYGKNKPRKGMPEGHLPVTSYLAVPVISRTGDVLGGLFFGHAELARFNEETERLVSAVANQAAVAIDNARLFASARDANAKLEIANQSLAARVAEEVTARTSAEQSVHAATEQFRLLVQGVVDYAIYMLDLEGRVSTWNAGAERIKGYTSDEVVGQHFSMFYTEDARTECEPARFLEEAREHGRTAMEGLRVRKDGSTFWASVVIDAVHDDQGQLIGFAKVTRDITEQRDAARELEAAREALFQSQKMESIGQLTGGIAHDFNNLLGAIGGSFSLIERRLKDGKAGAERYIAAGQDAVRRASGLTQRLLAFSRRQTLDPKPVDVNRLIVGMEELIRRTVGPSVEVEVVGQGGLWATRVDTSQLESALLNLCINGRDAMAPDGGRLTIETANKWLDDRSGRERDLIPGQYVSLCVTDTGCGMDREIISRVFEPFFTTKPMGQGTGLGLSMVYGFMRQSGGQVRVYSEVGKGTTMCLYLPRYAGSVDQAITAPDGQHVDKSSGETVLVIDDEPTLRMLVADVLEEAGYRVLQAGTGPDGLRVLQSDARIDLLVTDVGLPGGMNGRQVADAARVTRPDLKVLFITGFAENAAVGNGHLEPGMVVVTKPFVITDFAAKVRELIDQ
jgi:PAS domain S-box-containing protein